VQTTRPFPFAHIGGFLKRLGGRFSNRCIHLLLRQSFEVLSERVTNVMPRSFHTRPELPLRPNSRVVIQCACPDENHVGPVFGTQENMTAAGFAESTLFAGGGRIQRKVVLSRRQYESQGLGGQHRRECRPGVFSTIGTVAIGKHEQSPMYFIPDGTAVTNPCNHVFPHFMINSWQLPLEHAREDSNL